MITFLFWNLNRQPIEDTVVRLADRHEVDLLIFAECNTPAGRMLPTLNPPGTARFQRASGYCRHIEIYSRFPVEFLPPLWDKAESRLSIRRLVLPGRHDILVAALHMPGKRHWSGSSQAAECSNFARTIRDVEKEVGHSRTVLVGDLNMNPFEEGLVAANGFNAVMTRKTAEKGTRTVQAKNYPFFYNPMWAHFGDGCPGPPGTFFYDSAQHVTYFWNLFDQVLVRPDLLPFFRNEDLKILESDGITPFLSQKGIPKGACPTDHLPILFRLTI